MEIEEAVAKLVPQHPEVAGGVAESIRHGLVGKALDHGGPERFVASLPLRRRGGEVGFVTDWVSSHGN